MNGIKIKKNGFVQVVKTNSYMKKIVVLIIIAFFSCKNSTQESEQVNSTQSEISKDKETIKVLINDRIRKKEVPYFPSHYDNLTEVIIDTILYSSDKNKLAFFVIDKVKNKKRYGNITYEETQKMEELGNLPYEGYHYNAHAFIGKRNNNNILIKDFSVISIGKYKDIKRIKKRLRNLYFKEYSSINEEGYEYNLNDVRFWNNDNLWAW